MYLCYVKKDKLIEKANNLKYHNHALERTITYNQLISNHKDGLIAFIEKDQDYGFECALVDKIKLIKNVVQSRGESAIDEYIKLTRHPDINHPLYHQFRLITDLVPELKECFIRVKKQEFDVLLEIYNEVFIK